MQYNICLFCKKPYPKKRGKKYCSAKCKQAYYRYRKTDPLWRKSKEFTTPAQRMVYTKAQQLVLTTCEYCHKTYFRSGLEGRLKKYCSQSCRQRAYRQRKTAQERASM